MRLEHEFTVPVPVERAWEVLLDVRQIAPCMPGATLDTVEGDAFTGRVAVKVGPISMSYAGSASFVERDATSYRAVVEAKGRETSGTSTGEATVTAQLTDEGSSTRVTVLTDLAITGKPAQLGRGVMNEVGDRLIAQFADRLASTIASPGYSGAETAASAGGDTDAADAEDDQKSRPTPEAIDLMAVAGASLVKRAVPVIAALVVAVVLWRLLGRRRWAGSGDSKR